MHANIMISRRNGFRRLLGGAATARPGTLQDSPRDALLVGGAVAFLFFVILIGWASVTRLDAAAYGEGQVAVSGNRQTVQHREGGNIVELKVREGQHVKAGQILIRLSGSEVAATERALKGSVTDLQAQKARLEADIRGGAIIWPEEFRTATGNDRPLVDRAMQLQVAQRATRQNLLASTRSVLRQQEAQAASQSGGLAAQAQSSMDQRASLQAQLDGSRALAEKGYVSKNTVRALERGLAQLEGAKADYTARAVAMRQQAGETREQVIQSERKSIDDSASLLRDTQFQLNEAMPKWIAAKDQLEHTVIRAPVAGRIVGLKVFTVGGVIQPGQPILDVVPDAAPLIVRANFQPSDIDGVAQGREAEIKFLSIHERDLPILLGVVRNVSADTLRDEQSGRSYYTVEVVVPKSQMALLTKIRGDDTGVHPGVPAQVVVKLRKRTALQYLLEPVTEAMARSLHER